MAGDWADRELARFYTVCDKGRSLFAITAHIVSRSNAEDVFKLEVWKRYRDIKRLHKALYAIYSTLQLRVDDFPPFPKKRLLGRFDPRLTEERRQRAEDLLQFSVTVSALHQSQEIRVFFQGGAGQSCPPLQRVTARNGLWLPLAPPLGPGPSPGIDQGWHPGHGLELASRVTQPSTRTTTETSDSPELLHDATDTHTPELKLGAAACLELGSRSPPTDTMAFPESSLPGGGGGGGTGPLSKAASYLDRVRGSPSRRAALDATGGKGAYLLQAAAQIRLALEEEAAERYEGAFNHYQSSVGLLLRGVQADPDPVRREAVRRKTQQYLMRAEHIFTQHLGNGPAHSTGFSSVGLRHIRSLSGAPEELKYYKVLSIIDKVLLVKNQNTGEKYILKLFITRHSILNSRRAMSKNDLWKWMSQNHYRSVRKTSGNSPGRRTVLPQGIPYMVPLLRYFITDDSVFLLLQHVQGGRLWSHVKKQFSSQVPFGGFARQHHFTCRATCGMRGSVTSPNLKQYAGATPGRWSNSPRIADLCDGDDDDGDEGGGSAASDVTPRVGFAHPAELRTTDVDGETHSAGTPDSQRSGHVCGLLGHSVKECLSHNGVAAEDASSSSDCGIAGHLLTSQQVSVSGPDACGNTRATNGRVPTSDGTATSLSTPAATAASDHGGSTCRSTTGSPSKSTGRRHTPGPRACSQLAREDGAEEQNGARSPVRAVDLKLKPKPSPMRDRRDVPYTITVNPFEVIGGQEIADDVHSNPAGNFSGLARNYDREGSYLALTQRDSSDLRDAFASYSSALFNTAERKEHLCNGATSENDDSNKAGESSRSLAADSLSSTPGLVNTPQGAVAVDRLEPGGAEGEQYDCDLNGDDRSVHLNPASAQGSFGAMGYIPNGNGEHFCASSQDSSSDAFEQIPISAGNDNLRIMTTSRTDPDASCESTGNGFDDNSENERSKDEPGLKCGTAKVSDLRLEKNSTTSDTGYTGGGCGGGRCRRDRLFVAAAPPSSRSCPVRQPLAVPEKLVRVWAVQLVQALDGLHKQGLVCGDLNPRNVLLESTGHVRMTYFSQWSEVERTFSQSATQDMYCAPEMVATYQETEVSDWWSLGVLLYELLTGEALCHCHPTGITAHTRLSLPFHLSDEAQSLLRQLLQFNPAERLGSGPSGADEIRSHHFFSSIDWDQLHG